MDTKEATRICDQCNKEVAEANFALHETHCRRFLCLCPDCDEPVPKEQLDQHRLDQHTQVKCSKCNRKVERCHLMDHEADECEERLQSCEFCQLEVPWKELEEHTVACGSRTELCGDCGRYVTRKDQLEHDRTCPATNNVPGPPSTASSAPNKSKGQIPVTCRGCMASFPAEEIEEHLLRCVPASRWDLEDAEKEEEEVEEEEEEEEKEEEKEEEGDFSREEASTRLSSSLKTASLSVRPSRELWSGRGYPNQISTCPHCHLALPLLTLRWHAVKCQIHLHLK